MLNIMSKIKNALTNNLALYIVTFSSAWLMVSATATMKIFHADPIFLKVGVVASIALALIANVVLLNLDHRSKVKD